MVRELGGVPIDYKNTDFVKEIHRLTEMTVDAVFDGIGGTICGAPMKLCASGRVTTRLPVENAWGTMASPSEGRHPFASREWVGSSCAFSSAGQKHGRTASVVGAV